jgi:plastocyanin
MVDTKKVAKGLRTVLPVAMLGIVGAFMFGVTSAHEAAGGTVAGKISFKGTPPAAEPMAVSVNTEQCGTEQEPIEMVTADGSVRWAVVRIVGAEGDFPAGAEPPVLDQRGCRFDPHVVVVPVGQTLKVLNNDGILHNVHTFPEKNTAMNVAQPGFRKTMDTSFSEAEVVRVGCDVHAWMGAQIVVTDTPFIAVTDETGAFSIAGVPAGTYTVSIWHETFGEQTQEITVTEGQQTDLAVTMGGN